MPQLNLYTWRALAIRRFIYVYSPFHPNQEAHYFPPALSTTREDFIGLIAQAGRAHPIGYQLAQQVYVQGQSLTELANVSGAPRYVLHQALHEFVKTLVTLSQQHEKESL